MPTESDDDVNQAGQTPEWETTDERIVKWDKEQTRHLRAVLRGTGDIDALRAEAEAAIARGERSVYFAPSEVRLVFDEITRLRGVVDSLAARCAAQSDVLSREAARKD